MKRYKTEAGNSFFSVAAAVVKREVDYSMTVSFTNLVNLESIERIRARAKKSERPTYTALLAKAVALALTEMTYANRRAYRPFGILPARFQKFITCDIAIAAEVDIPDREYIAFFDVIRDVEKKSLSDVGDWLSNFRSNIGENAQWKTYSSIIKWMPRMFAKWLISMPTIFPKMWSKYRGGAVLISSPAKYGVDGLTGAWPSPIGLSYGFVKDRAIVENGVVRAAPTFHLLMNFDRRLMAGAPAARFFRRLVDILENMEYEFANDPLIKSGRVIESSQTLIQKKTPHIETEQ